MPTSWSKLILVISQTRKPNKYQGNNFTFYILHFFIFACLSIKPKIFPPAKEKNLRIAAGCPLRGQNLY
jgi:hypothetical protein